MEYLQFLILLTAVFISQELVLNQPVLIDEISDSNDNGTELEKLEYVHTNPQPEELLNCSNFVVQHEYILLENGSLFLPGSESIHEYNTYFLQNDTAFLCEEGNTVESTTESIYHFSKEFLTCGHVLIEPHEYELLENNDIYIEIYSKTYDPRNYYMQEHGVYVCIPPEFEEMKMNGTTNDTFSNRFNKFPESFTYVTNVGLSVSIISLMSHLAVFGMVSSVRNLPGCCLASLSVSLLIAYCCFLAVALVGKVDNCADLGLCVYYFFLTSFFWMNAIAFDIWRSFRVVMRELRISSHRVPWRRFLIYSLYSWSIPGVLTVLVKYFDTNDVLPKDYKPSFDDSFCWFGQRKALLVFFAVPLIFVMILNAIFFLDVTYVISRATLKTSQSHEANLKKRFFMFMRLALIMGLTWIVGLIAGYADNLVMWYIFILLNTLQGLFIFIVFSCSSKVRGLCFKKYRRRNKKRGSTSVRTISQISAAV